MKNSYVLIIGGTGFVGGVLADALKSKGYKNVHSVSRSLHGVDVTDQKTLEPYISKADIVINMAGLVSFFRKDFEKLMAINHEGALNVLNICERYKNVNRLIYISSTASFGFNSETIAENTKFNWEKYKFLGYSYSKFLPNEAIQLSRQETNIIYPPLVVGPEDQTNTKKLLDYVRGKKFIFAPPGANGIIDVRDLCEAIILVMKKAKNKENYIVNEQNISLAGLFDALSRSLGQNSIIIKIPSFLRGLIFGFSVLLEKCGVSVPSESIFLGFKKRRFSSSKIKSDLGFTTKHDIKKLT